MKIAVVGCLHGELDIIYDKVEQIEKIQKIFIDLVLVCGDSQTLRNENDYQCMAVPPKYRRLGTFHQYYFHEKLAPKLTILIGGNHECSNYLQTLPYGGWVAPNMYYLGYCSVIRYGPLRIGGISGIFKGHDAKSGHFESLPYDPGTMRSVYHMRETEIYKLLQLKSKDQENILDVFMSHDWPINIHECASQRDLQNLLRRKPHFRSEIETNRFGNPLLQPVVHHLRPKHWFAAHMHAFFTATVLHPTDNDQKRIKTEFQALDKVLPGRHFLHVVDVDTSDDDQSDKKLEYDCEWLAILKKTDHLWKGSNDLLREINIFNCANTVEITEEDLDEVVKLFDNDLTIPENFQPCKPVLDRKTDLDPGRKTNYLNSQTSALCARLDIWDPNELFAVDRKAVEIKNPDEINLDSDDDEEEDNDKEGKVIHHKNPDEIDLDKDQDNSQPMKRLKSDDLFIIDTKGTLS